MKRINSIDFTRGLVMIIMALDHVRDLIHADAVTQSPTNLETTTPVLFFTRWITYLCAPIFVFLAGSSAYLSFKRKKNLKESRAFLLKRGLWLLLLEFTVMNFVIFFDLGFHTLLFQVIAAFGIGFIVLSLLLKASPKAIGITGLAIMLLHNLAPIIPFAETSLFKRVLMPFFAPGAFPIGSGRVFIMGYPPIPWIGIMLAGFASGKFFELSEEKRKNLFIKIGLIALSLFVIIRFINIYGDSFKWTSQKNTAYTFLSFINVTKYPPSLLFCLVTLGIMFLILAFSERVKGWLLSFVSVYGRVPLFYFVIHFFLIHIIMVTIMLIQGFNWSQMNFAAGSFGRPKGVESGLPLGAVYLIWPAVVLLLYKPCVWFDKYKSTHKNWWSKYI